LHPEDVGVGAVDFGLDDSGYIGLKLDIVDEEEFAILVDGGGDVSLIGALLDVAGIEAKDAGGVGGAETDRGVGPIVVAIDGNVDLATLGGEFDGFVVAHGGFDKEGVGPVDVVGAEVEGDVDEVDAVVGEKAHLDTFGQGGGDEEEEADYGEETFHF